jgi:hypothetical protein
MAQAERDDITIEALLQIEPLWHEPFPPSWRGSWGCWPSVSTNRMNGVEVRLRLRDDTLVKALAEDIAGDRSNEHWPARFDCRHMNTVKAINEKDVSVDLHWRLVGLSVSF